MAVNNWFQNNRMSAGSLFVTGAAAGIGRATAQLFAGRGWRVGAHDVDAAGLASLAAELGPERCVTGRLDVTDFAAMQEALAHFAAGSGGRLDLMFNNAGLVAAGDFESLPAARYGALVDVNLKGVIHGALAAFPYLKATPGSRLVSMCSASAIYGSPAYAAYCATKFGVRGLTEALDIEWQRHGIRVMDVLPLFVNTAMVTGIPSQRSMEKLGVRLAPEDIAETVWRAAHWRLWRRVHWYPGLQSRLLALAQKLSPAVLNRLTTKMVSGY